MTNVSQNYDKIMTRWQKIMTKFMTNKFFLNFDTRANILEIFKSHITAPIQIFDVKNMHSYKHRSKFCFFVSKIDIKNLI